MMVKRQMQRGNNIAAWGVFSTLKTIGELSKNKALILTRALSILSVLGMVWFGLLQSSAAWAENPAPAPQMNATSYLLVDLHSDTVLLAEDPDKRIEPASITKMMTAYLLYEALKAGRISLADKVSVSEKAWRMEGSRMYLELNTQVELEKMLKGLIIQSGNDAAVALAEHVAGSESEFVDQMNEKARVLGMHNTNYENSTGMPGPQHYTTAYDIVLLTRALIKDFPEEYKTYAEKEYTYNKIRQHNRNKLLWRDKSVDGVKTGHTQSAGYCLVASAKRNNMRLISVVLGTESEKARADYSAKLLEYGFQYYETNLPYRAGVSLGDARVWKGNKSSVPLGVDGDFYLTTLKGTYDRLDASMNISRDIQAPIKKGQVLGKVVVKDGEKVVGERDLVALGTVEKSGIWGSFIDGIKMLFSD